MSIAETTRPHLVTREAAAARIEALEAALREVLEKLKASNASAWTIFDIRNIINAALAPEQDK